MKYILIGSIALNVAFAVALVIVLPSQNMNTNMVASTSQLECLENWKGSMEVVGEIAFPEHFEGHYLISTPAISKNDLYVEYSGCFYKAHSTVDSVEGILSIYNHFQSEWGYDDISIYKSPDNDNAFIYAK